MPTERPLNVGIGIKATDKTGLQLLKDVNTNLKDTTTKLAEAKKAGGLRGIVADAELEKLEQYRTRIGELNNAVHQTEAALKGIDASDAQFETLTAQAEAYRQELLGINEAIAKTPQRTDASGFSGNSQIAGKGGGALSAIAGAAGQFGVPGSGEALAAGGAALQAAQGFKELQKTLSEGPGLFKSLSEGGAALLTGVIGPAAAGFGALVAVAAPLILIIGGIAVAMTALNNQAAEAKKGVDDYVAARKRALGLETDLNKLIASGDSEAAKARLDQAKSTVDQSKRLQADIQAQIDANDKAYADLGQSLNVGERDRLRNIGDALRKQLNDELEQTFVPASEEMNQIFAAFPDIDKAAAARQETEKQVAALLQRADIEKQLTPLIQAGNVAALQARKKQNDDELAIIEGVKPALLELAGTSKDADAQIAALIDREKYLKDENAELTTGVLASAEARKTELDAVNATLAAIQDQVTQQTQLAGLLKTGTSQQVADRIDAANIERDAIQSILPQLEALKGSSDAADQALDAAQKRIKELNGELNNLSTASPLIAQRERIQGLAAIEQAEVETDRKVTAIRANGFAQRAAIETAAVEASIANEKKRDDAINDINTKLAASIGQINSSYMATERKAYQDFAKENLRLSKQHDKDRLNLLANINSQLLKAEENNDVIAFLAAKEAGDQQLRAQAENYDDAAKQRTEDFLAARQEAKEANDQRIADLQAQATIERAAAQQAFKEQQEQIDAQTAQKLAKNEADTARLVAAEEEGLAQRIFAIADSYNLEKGLIDDVFAKRKQKYEDDNALINQQLDDALARHDADTKAKAAAEQASNKAVTDALTASHRVVSQSVAAGLQSDFTVAVSAIQSALQSMVGSVYASVSAAISNANSSSSGSSSGYGPYGYGSSSSSSGGGGSSVPVAFANEGFVNKPTIGLLGEDLKPGEIEAVMKFKPSDGFPGGRPGGNTFNFNYGDITIGNGMSREEVTTELENIRDGMFDGLAAARNPNGAVP